MSWKISGEIFVSTVALIKLPTLGEIPEHGQKFAVTTAFEEQAPSSMFQAARPGLVLTPSTNSVHL